MGCNDAVLRQLKCDIEWHLDQLTVTIILFFLFKIKIRINQAEFTQILMRNINFNFSGKSKNFKKLIIIFYFSKL
jgi:hypothetical protein